MEYIHSKKLSDEDKIRLFGNIVSDEAVEEWAKGRDFACEAHRRLNAQLYIDLKTFRKL